MPGLQILWSDPEKTAILTKENGNQIELHVGSLISYKERNGFVKITGFTSKDSDKRGPIGVTYLPWRGERWASELFTLKGNPRHLIAFPVGMRHYGEQIDWNSVELAGKDAELQIQMFLLKV
jgi:hypothetical protein